MDIDKIVEAVKEFRAVIAEVIALIVVLQSFKAKSLKLKGASGQCETNMNAATNSSRGGMLNNLLIMVIFPTVAMGVWGYVTFVPNPATPAH